MSVEIRQVPLGGNLKDFLNVVDYIYRDDPHYVRSLDMDLKGRLSPGHPFFKHAQGTLFTAHRNGYCVGRISAQVCQEHLKHHQDQTGFFGFIDTVDDEEVVQELLRKARRWLSARGVTRVRGPLSMSTNDECGCLVEGFETPPMVMMHHHRPYQGKLIESAGFDKTKTLYAWRYEVGPVKPRVQKAHDDVAALPEVSVRTVDMNHVERDSRILMNIFNDAWGDAWGHVPYTQAELKHFAKELKLVINPELTRIAMVDGEAAAIAVALPNVNEAIRDLNGSLFPMGLPKLLYRLKVTRPKTARLILLGIASKFRKQRKYAGLSLYLYALLNESGQRLGIQWGELGWTDEDNGPVNAAIKMMGGKVYKKYAIYEREV